MHIKNNPDGYEVVLELFLTDYPAIFLVVENTETPDERPAYGESDYFTFMLTVHPCQIETVTNIMVGDPANGITLQS